MIRIQYFFILGDPTYPTAPIRLVDVGDRPLSEDGAASGWQGVSGGSIMQATTMKTMSTSKCSEWFGSTLDGDVICALPRDPECANIDEWRYSPTAYLSGYPSGGEQRFYTLEEAQDAALGQADVGGVTFDANVYTLRRGSSFIYNIYDQSWIKPKYPCGHTGTTSTASTATTIRTTTTTIGDTCTKIWFITLFMLKN